MTGMLIFDYFLVRKAQLHVGDLYKGNKASAYWYVAGFNWRTFIAWIMGVWPLLRKSCYPPHAVTSNTNPK
jgi:nucleobase:cation symporter-1, NCS1 family